MRRFHRADCNRRECDTAISPVPKRPLLDARQVPPAWRCLNSHHAADTEHHGAPGRAAIPTPRSSVMTEVTSKAVDPHDMDDEEFDEPIPAMQQLLDNPFLLLFIGVAMPTVLYVIWGVMEIVGIPIAK
jgi:hypothetical protein